MLLFAGCTYAPRAAADRPDADPTTPPDVDDPDVPPPQGVACSAPETTGLVLCLEFDDDVQDGTLDDSAPGHHDAVTTGLSPATRTMPSPSPAALIGASSVTRVADDPVLDRDAAYTFAAWVRPDALPAEGSVYGIIDHEEQYAMLIGHSIGGTVENRCVHTGVAKYEYTENLTAGAWSFLACTWNGTELCAYRWTADGDHEHYCHVPAIKPNATGSHGLAIGHLSEEGDAHSRFGGALDSIQMYDHGMTEDQLCTLIGKGSGCMPCTFGCL